MVEDMMADEVELNWVGLIQKCVYVASEKTMDIRSAVQIWRTHLVAAEEKRKERRREKERKKRGKQLFMYSLPTIG